MSHTVSGGETYTVSAAQTDTGDVVLSGGMMVIVSGGVADTTTVSSGGFVSLLTRKNYWCGALDGS